VVGKKSNKRTQPRDAKNSFRRTKKFIRQKAIPKIVSPDDPVPALMEQ
jgi:hypothetical protein